MLDEKIKKFFPELWKTLETKKKAPTIEERLTSVEKAVVDIALMQSGGGSV